MTVYQSLAIQKGDIIKHTVFRKDEVTCSASHVPEECFWKIFVLESRLMSSPYDQVFQEMKKTG